VVWWRVDVRLFEACGACRGVETGKLGSLCRIWVFNIVLWHSSAQVDGIGRIRERQSG